MSKSTVEIIQFSNQSRADKKLLQQFVDFHWHFYADEPRFIPLLDYEFLGMRLLGIDGWFEPHHLFFKHATIAFFIARQGNRIVGRTCAFVNHNHNKHHQDSVGFFGFFECINDPQVAAALLEKAAGYLSGLGMTSMRGPQNFPVNEATPGVLIDGFDAKPYIYYHYNFPYYADLLAKAGFNVVKKVVSYDVPVQTPIQERLLRVTEKVIKRYEITIETFTRKRYQALREWMLEIYNEAWHDNWGFVPFEQEEFFKNLDDMQLIWDPKMFIFAFVKGEPAGFFGAVPNILEKMRPIPGLRRAELWRAGKMLLTKSTIRSFRLGYLGIRPHYRKIGLDAVLLSHAKRYTQEHNYQQCDIGWVLEDNELIHRVTDFMGGTISRTYAVYEKDLRFLSA